VDNRITVLFIGDVVGDNGLSFLVDNFKTLKSKYSPDFIIVNGENIWEGKGLNQEEANRLFKQGVNVITTGNHVWENWKSRPLLQTDKRVIRPANYPKENEGSGLTIIEVSPELKIAVMQLQGRTYMQPIDCPFKKADELLNEINNETRVIILDFHAEATAEKISMGWHLDGRVSAVLGTHTHVQTADACILPKGTAYITDVGMTGPYDSVLGMNKEVSLKRLILQTAHKFELADDDFRIAGAVLSIDSTNGIAHSIRSFVYPAFETGL